MAERAHTSWVTLRVVKSYIKIQDNAVSPDVFKSKQTTVWSKILKALKADQFSNRYSLKKKKKIKNKPLPPQEKSNCTKLPFSEIGEWFCLMHVKETWHDHAKRIWQSWKSASQIVEFIIKWQP